MVVILLLLIYVLLGVEGEQVLMVLLLHPVLVLVQVVDRLVDLVEVLKVSIHPLVVRIVLVELKMLLLLRGPIPLLMVNRFGF